MNYSFLVGLAILGFVFGVLVLIAAFFESRQRRRQRVAIVRISWSRTARIAISGDVYRALMEQAERLPPSPSRSQAHDLLRERRAVEAAIDMIVQRPGQA